jgi:hypothetical protein
MASKGCSTVRLLAMAALLLGIAGATQAAGSYLQSFRTLDGVVILGYAPSTRFAVVANGGKVVHQGVVFNTQPITMPLKPGSYTLRSDDEVLIVSTSVATYLRKADAVADPMKAIQEGRATAQPVGAMQAGPIRTLAATGMWLQPVPWVGDATYASNPPSVKSRHTVFLDVPTRLKVVIKGGTPPYKFRWDPGDGSGFGPWTAASTSTWDPTGAYGGAAMFYTYASGGVLSIGSLVQARVEVQDSSGLDATANYWIVIGNPSNQTDRVNRSADEALWYLHTHMYRADGFSYAGEPAADIGYLYTHETGGHTVSPTAMYAINLENSGRSIYYYDSSGLLHGGINLSQDPTKDALAEDLYRCINALTSKNWLVQAPITSLSLDASHLKHYASGASLNPDTHPAGGNSLVLYSNTDRPVYEGGMHLQALAQAGFTDAPVPNGYGYASYYDLIGDFVDGFQYMQGNASYYEGGWRYNFYYGDSDGSAVAWAAIGLNAAEHANDLTPAPAAHPGAAGRITVDPVVKSELANYWLPYDQYTSLTDTSTVQNYNILGASGNYAHHYYGGFGYTSPDYGTNAGKTGGGLLALKYSGAADTLPAVQHAQGFLYRWFWTYDPKFGWSSARDAYGMYNMLKGLIESHVTLLTDPDGSGGNDMDGMPLSPIDWFSRFADYVAGTGLMVNSGSIVYMDLGHQKWPGNPISQYYSGNNDGHYESIGVRGWPVPPFVYGEWGEGASDGNAGSVLVTEWYLAVITGAVFTPGPNAVIGHPNAGEIYIPIQINGFDYQAVFDPGGSSDLNPVGTINKAVWNFGDGSAPVTVNIAAVDSGGPGGVVPIGRPGNQILHHYSALGDYNVTLTVYDDQGLSGSTNTVVHVVTRASFTPTPVMSFVSVDTYTNGTTVGINDDASSPNFGKVTIQFDGSYSYNTDPTSVSAPKNNRGISSFAWEWPTASTHTTTADTAGDNSGVSGDPFGLDEGVLDVSGTFNVGSKAPVQTYTFNFGTDPTKWPAGMIVSLDVMSNIVQVSGQPPNHARLDVTVGLRRNSEVPVHTLVIKRIGIGSITRNSVRITVVTTNELGQLMPSAIRVNYGTTTAYGLFQDDLVLSPTHTITLTGLAPNTVYHFKVHATGNMQAVDSADYVFKTLP